MHLLVVNAGSSTLRYALVETAAEATVVGETIETGGRVADALEYMRERLAGYPSPDAIGHRVVHGGPELVRPVVIDARVESDIASASKYAPLHNPANLEAIRACRQAWPDARHVAVFDTGFHTTIPEHTAAYALPSDLVGRHGIRRYGFHGISHEQLMLDTAEFLGKPVETLKMITLHLGNGASATAIERGRSVDTSMGMTPTEGLVMGTRSGDLDPGILGFLLREEGLDGDGVDELVNRRSGLLGLCGDADMREVRARANSGDADAQLALRIYVYRLRKYIGAYLAVLGRIDALVFSGGVGEHHPWLIGEVLKDLPVPGLHLGDGLPTEIHPPVDVSSDDSEVAVLVLPADETRSIARQALALIRGQST